jgi:DNA-binding response OmpR family regulator
VTSLAFFIKPFNDEEFLAAVRAALAQTQNL